jgi:hypothetical protein
MEAGVKELFERYEKVFRGALRGSTDVNEAALLYASEFIAATPAGVMDMRMRGLRISPIDEQHCVAHVAWTATYAREPQPDVTIDFEVHYFVQELNSGPKVFGWVSGDEQAVLREHGII